MATEKTTNSDTVQPNERILFIPLSDILTDYTWNVRSKADIERESADGVRDGSREAGFGFHDFTKSFNEGGQDTPVILAEVVNGKTLRGQKTDKKYELIAGFRRFTAVDFLNQTENAAKRKANDEKAVGSNAQAVANVPDGHIKAVVRKFKDAREFHSSRNKRGTWHCAKLRQQAFEGRKLARSGRFALARRNGPSRGQPAWWLASTSNQ
jgi:hypothetical protein